MATGRSPTDAGARRRWKSYWRCSHRHGSAGKSSCRIRCRSARTRCEEIMMSELDPRAAGAKRLKDKVCVITGASQGIGGATARRLGEEGRKIVVAERIDESATRSTAELREHAVQRGHFA